jgi:hypothetical protein
VLPRHALLPAALAELGLQRSQLRAQLPQARMAPLPAVPALRPLRPLRPTGRSGGTAVYASCFCRSANHCRI